MENASKALIIAGAVLIAIVLISFGVILVNRSRGTTQQAADTQNFMTQSATEGTETINANLSGMYDFT